MIHNKNYKSISEVSELLKIKKHVIRYWDTRFEGISTRLGIRKRRFFSPINIKKLQDLKNILYADGKSHNSFDLANKLIVKKKLSKKNSINESDTNKQVNNSIKILNEISTDLKKILDSLN